MSSRESLRSLSSICFPVHAVLVAGLIMSTGCTEQVDTPPTAASNPFDESHFVRLEAGTFMMGSDAPDAYPDEQPVRKVTITQPFYIGKTEVTRGHWAAVMGSDPGSFGGDLHPVDGISWNDIQEFLTKLNALAECNACYRLPTEAEWEYAARAGTSSMYSFGDDTDRLANHAWFSGNAEFSTHPVAQKEPNAWGLYDMHGNVYEWVQDRYAAYENNPVTDPTGPSEGETYVIRGGSWTDGAREQRLTYRDYYAPDHRHNFFGFRLVRTSS